MGTRELKAFCALDEATKELLKLASDIEGDKAITVQENENPSGEEKVDEENGDDNVDGRADERLGMSEVELEELEEEIKPVHLMLTKVS